MLPEDTEVDVKLFLDQSIAEIYVMRGRLAFTVGAGSSASAGEAGMLLWAGEGGEGVSARNISAWHLNSCWVTQEEVLAQRDLLKAGG